MDVWTEADRDGFRYTIVAEAGSEYIRSRVFHEALEAEQKMWREGTAARGAITAANYVFGECPAAEAGPGCVTLTPRRKDVLLVDGAIFLHPETGDLERVEGSLVKSPSFWTRGVRVVRRYMRIGGTRVPVSLESTASVRLAGLSTLVVTYEYESVNGVRVGTPIAVVQ